MPITTCDGRCMVRDAECGRGDVEGECPKVHNPYFAGRSRGAERASVHPRDAKESVWGVGDRPLCPLRSRLAWVVVVHVDLDHEIEDRVQHAYTYHTLSRSHSDKEVPPYLLWALMSDAIAMHRASPLQKSRSDGVALLGYRRGTVKRPPRCLPTHPIKASKSYNKV